MMKVFSILEKYKKSEKTAIIQEDGVSITYTDLYKNSIFKAEELKDSSQNILVYIHNKIDFVIAIFAAWYAGKTVIPLGINLSENEVNSIAEFCESDTIIIDADSEASNIDVKNKLYAVKKDLKNWDVESIDFNDYINEGISLICPTTGTTSKPKFAMITSESILNEIENIKHAYGYSEKTIKLIVTPLSSITALIGMLIVILYCHGTLVLYNDKFNPLKICRVIKENKVNSTFATSSLFLGMTKVKSINLEDLKSLKRIVIGGEMVNKEFIVNTAKKIEGCKILPAYGLTEAASLVATYDKNRSNPIDSVGVVIPNFKAKVIKSNGEEGSLGEEGEILIKGPALMKGYYKNIKGTNEVLENGWLRTGDIGKIDEEGFLYIRGRKKNIAIIGGVNVHFEEVEEYISRHESVKLVHAYSKKSKVTGEELLADVVLNDGCELDSKEIIKFCKEGLSAFKIPKKINIVNNIELSLGGKLRR